MPNDKSDRDLSALMPVFASPEYWLRKLNEQALRTRHEEWERWALWFQTHYPGVEFKAPTLQELAAEVFGNDLPPLPAATSLSAAVKGYHDQRRDLQAQGNGQ